MMIQKRYLVIANRHAQLGVTVRDGYEPREGDAILYTSDSIDEAFDWKEHMDSAIARVAGRHCATCE